ncbi:hypothetical protein F0562_004322 [Nyssa sinensis]|uniref:Uncharacterized protein n=1 Tax=Nyssa sinensis TaxID=561372 RepID=A0A5J5BXI7_9ASTE|nr:hypothetical protein F0562_004322 [Nyssa sinensis]
MVTVAMESWVMEDDGDGGDNGEIWWFGWDERGGADWCGTLVVGDVVVRWRYGWRCWSAMMEMMMGVAVLLMDGGYGDEGRCAMVEGEVDGGCGWMVRWICGLGRRWLVVAATDLMVATWWLWEMKSPVLMGDDGAVARGSDGRGGGGTVMVGRGDDGGVGC